MFTGLELAHPRLMSCLPVIGNRALLYVCMFGTNDLQRLTKMLKHSTMFIIGIKTKHFRNRYEYLKLYLQRKALCGNILNKHANETKKSQ